MALTNKEKQQALRKRRAEAGLKELRGVWIRNEEENTLKHKICDALKKMRKARD